METGDIELPQMPALAPGRPLHILLLIVIVAAKNETIKPSALDIRAKSTFGSSRGLFSALAVTCRQFAAPFTVLLCVYSKKVNRMCTRCGDHTILGDDRNALPPHRCRWLSGSKFPRIHSNAVIITIIDPD